mmetsp:Transcript_7335/g.17887  ORF Transcript_7335/g.17887 Transcript_7335/m.17887 type:complete len:600 (+) Transcript_7335:72-1871(+)
MKALFAAERESHASHVHANHRPLFSRSDVRRPLLRLRRLLTAVADGSGSPKHPRGAEVRAVSDIGRPNGRERSQTIADLDTGGDGGWVVQTAPHAGVTADLAQLAHVGVDLGVELVSELRDGTIVILIEVGVRELLVQRAQAGRSGRELPVGHDADGRLEVPGEDVHGTVDGHVPGVGVEHVVVPVLDDGGRSDEIVVDLLLPRLDDAVDLGGADPDEVCEEPLKRHHTCLPELRLDGLLHDVPNLDLVVHQPDLFFPVIARGGLLDLLDDFERVCVIIVLRIRQRDGGVSQVRLRVVPDVRRDELLPTEASLVVALLKRLPPAAVTLALVLGSLVVGLGRTRIRSGRVPPGVLVDPAGSGAWHRIVGGPIVGHVAVRVPSVAVEVILDSQTEPVTHVVRVVLRDDEVAEVFAFTGAGSSVPALVVRRLPVRTILGQFDIVLLDETLNPPIGVHHALSDAHDDGITVLPILRNGEGLGLFCQRIEHTGAVVGGAHRLAHRHLVGDVDDVRRLPSGRRVFDALPEDDLVAGLEEILRRIRRVQARDVVPEDGGCRRDGSDEEEESCCCLRSDEHLFFRFFYSSFYFSNSRFPSCFCCGSP